MTPASIRVLHAHPTHSASQTRPVHPSHPYLASPLTPLVDQLAVLLELYAIPQHPAVFRIRASVAPLQTYHVALRAACSVHHVLWMLVLPDALVLTYSVAQNAVHQVPSVTQRPKYVHI